MSILLSCQNITKSFGLKPLFEDVSLGIHEYERVAIIGPNGSGKSTLLKMMAGDELPDEGKITQRKNLRLVYLSQQENFPAKKSIEEIVTAEQGRGDHVLIKKTLGKMGFGDLGQEAASLSGGWKKRLSIACAIVKEPEVLLLDEPTNHLDLEGILWLEDFLQSASFAFVVISHDRSFLENTCNKTIELNRSFPGGFYSADVSYTEFLERKKLFLDGQLQQQASLANKVRREEEWLSRGPKARTTKQQARIENAAKLQSELAELNSRNRQSTLDIDFNASQRQTKKLIRLKEIDKTLGGKTLLKKFNLTLSPGMRLGLLGLNASGKSTLLKILAGKLEVDQGEVERAHQLKIVYFEQNRDALSPNVSLKRTLAPDGDSVISNGRSVHVVTWAKKFLFRPDQMDTPVERLSGGEQARLLIARLMLEPADVLLLDEPTNDLDIPTLEVLEESLLEFPGAIVLVTHDRFMLDRISNRLLALDGSGNSEYFSDFTQWQAHSGSAGLNAATQPDTRDQKREAVVDKTDKGKTSNKRLSYLEQREYDHMENNIADAEGKLLEIQEQLENPEYASRPVKLKELYDAMSDAQTKVETLYSRWAELEAKLK